MQFKSLDLKNKKTVIVACKTKGQFMKGIFTFLTIGSIALSSTVLTAQNQQKNSTGNYNSTATQLFIAQVQNGNITPEKLKKFKQKGADINAMYTDVNGKKTNLFLESVHFPNVREIRPCRDGSFNFSPEAMNRHNLLVTLVSLGADTKVTDSTGKNAITLAILGIGCSEYRDSIIPFLHRNGRVPLDKADNVGGTPLMYALIVTKNPYQDENGGVPALVSYLVKNKANVNAADSSGCTVLMFAAQYNTLETVKYLLTNGANMAAKTKQGATVLDFAKKREKILKYLENKMLDDL